MPLKVREIKAALKSKGFLEEQRHHQFYVYYHNGKKSNIYTRISHGESEVGDRLCARMARQINLSRGEFDRFVDCSLSAHEYGTILAEKNLL